VGVFGSQTIVPPPLAVPISWAATGDAANTHTRPSQGTNDLGLFDIEGLQ
jgi:hypothetical protein